MLISKPELIFHLHVSRIIHSVLSWLHTNQNILKACQSIPAKLQYVPKLILVAGSHLTFPLSVYPLTVRRGCIFDEIIYHYLHSKHFLLPLSHSVFSCVGVFWWISMSTTNNIAQARKLVEQLRIEAGIERIKVGRYFAALCLLVQFLPTCPPI